MPSIGKKYWTGSQFSNYQWFKIVVRRQKTYAIKNTELVDLYDRLTRKPGRFLP